MIYYFLKLYQYTFIMIIQWIRKAKYPTSLCYFQQKKNPYKTHKDIGHINWWHTWLSLPNRFQADLDDGADLDWRGSYGNETGSCPCAWVMDAWWTPHQRHVILIDGVCAGVGWWRWLRDGILSNFVPFHGVLSTFYHLWKIGTILDHTGWRTGICDLGIMFP